MAISFSFFMFCFCLHYIKSTSELLNCLPFIHLFMLMQGNQQLLHKRLIYFWAREPQVYLLAFALLHNCDYSVHNVMCSYTDRSSVQSRKQTGSVT